MGDVLKTISDISKLPSHLKKLEKLEKAKVKPKRKKKYREESGKRQRNDGAAVATCR